MTTMRIEASAAEPIALSNCLCGESHSLKEICLFLSEYASWLLGSGATCIRLEPHGEGYGLRGGDDHPSTPHSSHRLPA